MNLKEAFRYQKFLDDLLSRAVRDIADVDKAMKITRVHHKNAVDSAVEDEIEVVEDTGYVGSDAVVEFAESVISAKADLSCAISTAKKYASMDIDAVIDTNKARRDLIYGLKLLNKAKPKKAKKAESGYKFDINGVQQRYVYYVDEEYTPDFDQGELRRLIKEISAEADEFSNALDAALINTSVGFNPPYDVNSSYGDIIEEFAENL